MNRILPGQTWSMAASAAGAARTTFRILYVGSLVSCVTDKGREFTTAIKNLERGLRGARLLKNPDGSEPAALPAKPTKPAETRQESRTASELVRSHKPRGGPSERAVQAAKLRSEGMSLAAIAARMGVKASTVSRWCCEALAIEELEGTEAGR